MEKGGLATAVGRNQSNAITAVKTEIEMIQHGFATGIAKTDIF
jgi:hypothetical protein